MSAPPDPLAAMRGPTSKGKGEGRGEGGKGRDRREGEGEEGKGRRGKGFAPPSRPSGSAPGRNGVKLQEHV